MRHTSAAAILSVLLIASTLTGTESRCARIPRFVEARNHIVAEVTALVDGTERLRAAFVRGAFHDCVTASASKPGSGCNGSLRSATEMASPDNARLQRVVDHVTQLQAQRPCLSFADVLLIGMAVSIERAGGGNILNDVVSFANQRDDAPNGFDDFVNGGLELPGRTDPFATLETFYSNKGFTLRDFVASVAGGHTLGRFNPTPNPPADGTCPLPSGRLVVFVPDSTIITNSFAVNMHGRRDGSCNSAGFNTLPSDNAFLESTDAMNIMAEYAASEAVMMSDFRDFLVKMSTLTDQTVGNL